MKYSFIAETAETTVAMNNLNALADTYVAKDGEEGEDRGKSCLPIDDKKGHMVDFEAVGQIADSRAVVYRMCDNDDLVTTVDEFAGDLVNVRLDSARLREEEVADHGNIICAAGHDGLVILSGIHRKSILVLLDAIGRARRLILGTHSRPGW